MKKGHLNSVLKNKQEFGKVVSQRGEGLEQGEHEHCVQWSEYRVIHLGESHWMYSAACH